MNILAWGMIGVSYALTIAVYLGLFGVGWVVLIALAGVRGVITVARGSARAYIRSMTDTPSDRFRVRILEAFPAHAAREGWTDAAFKAAVAEAGLSEGEAALACPKGAFDLFDAFAARADAAMLEALEGLDLDAMKVRQRVRAAVQVRLEAQQPYKQAARAMTRALADRSARPKRRACFGAPPITSGAPSAIPRPTRTTIPSAPSSPACSRAPMRAGSATTVPTTKRPGRSSMRVLRM